MYFKLLGDNTVFVGLEKTFKILYGKDFYLFIFKTQTFSTEHLA